LNNFILFNFKFPLCSIIFSSWYEPLSCQGVVRTNLFLWHLLPRRAVW